MSTHSMIGYEHPDYSIEAIYCHWNGLRQWNGRMLVEHYASLDRVHSLLALGDLSELGPELGEAHDFGDHRPAYASWCLSYGRDRGDEDTAAERYADEAAFFAAARASDAAMVYLFRDGQWYAYSGRPASWYLVADALEAA